MAKILIVDDEPSVRITIREFLLEDNHEVHIAEDVDSALATINETCCDVVITDIVMPKYTGVTLLKKIKEVSQDIQVIMITGEPSVNTASEAVRSGAFEYLSKPIRDEDIKTVVNKAANYKKLLDDKKQLELENDAYQKQLEEMVIKRTNQLVDTQQKFELAVEGSANGLWIRNFETNENWVSKYYAQLLGYEPEEFNDSYEDWENRLHPEDRERVVESQNRHLSENAPFHTEYRLKTKSGNYKWFSASGVAIRDHRGQPLKMAGSLQDISTRKQSENQLQLSEERFKNLANSLPQVIFETDKQFNFTYINNYGLNFIGYESSDLINKFDLFSCLLDNESGELKQKFENLISDQNPINAVEQIFIKKDKMRLSVLLYAHPIIENKNVVGVRGFAIDITKQKESEDTIRKLSRSVEQSPVLIVITNKKGNVEYLNPKFSEVTGFSYEEVIGKNLRLIQSGKTPIETYKEMWDTILGGHEWKGELLNRKKDGQFYWEALSISPIKDHFGNITHFLGIKEDITDQKKMLVDLLDAKDKAEIADRLKSEFLAQMSHEIRTPINAIVSFSSLLREELHTNIPEDLEMGFNIIDKAGRRIIRTVDLLLNLSEIQAGTYEYTPTKIDLLGEVLSSLVLEFKPLANEKSLTFQFHLETEQTEVFADGYTVIQIFNNLLDNAIKFTQSGFISIDIFRDDNNKLNAKITDTGIGISKDYLPNLFAPFTQEDQGYTRKFEGNGIGLLLVKKFCEMNKITISIESIKNEGTIVNLLFP